MVPFLFMIARCVTRVGNNWSDVTTVTTITTVTSVTTVTQVGNNWSDVSAHTHAHLLGLQPSTYYCARVRANNSLGASAWGPTLTVRTDSR